jgi:RHS repeat-associated protein
MVDPRGHRTTYRYDLDGNPVEYRTPIATTLITYKPGNRVSRIQYGALGTEEFAYDDNGHLVEQKSQLTTSSFTHTASGLLASILDGEGGLTRLEYEGALRVPSRILLPDGTSKQFAYNASGRMIRSTDPLGGITQYEYDAAGRLVREIDPSGAETRTTYDAVFPQNIATVTDRAGRSRHYAYDALGRLVQETAPGGAITRYEYDADGNRTAVVDPLTNRYEFRYDAMNRLIQEIDPNGHQRLHRYDAAGNRIETVDRNGRRRTFTYDAHNRVVEERWHDPTDDQLVRSIAFTYNRNDELLTLSDPDATIQLGRLYVPGGPLQSEEARYTGAPARRIAYAYDGATRRSSVAVTTTSPVLEPAFSVGYTRDLAGRLRILQGRNPLPPSTLNGLAFQLELWRNPRGDVTEVRRFSDPNGDRQVSQSFLAYSDPCHCHLERIEHVVATNQPLPDATLVLSRDPEGALTQLQDGPNTFAFDYDPAGQLGAVRSAGVPIETYTYDPNGNRLASHRHDPYVVASGNRVTQAGSWLFTYDAEGNLLTKSNAVSGVHYSFIWDHRNRLTRVELEDPNITPGVDVTEYRYDALDRRIAVVRADGITWTYYDGLQPLVDFRDQETTPLRIQYTGEKLDELHALWQRDQGLFWLLNDHLGSPRHLLDRNGVEVGRFDYDSFGNLRSVSGSQAGAVGRFAFTGREWDPNTGLYYYRARYYDPDLGRFIQEDPMGFAAGDANLYRYVFNQPLTLTDPTGLMTAEEYAELLLALVRPGNFCQFALCVNNLWSGVANAVINLVPAGKPDAGCASNLVGVPDLSSLRNLGIDVGIAGTQALAELGRVSHPALDLGADLLICALKN